MISYEKIDCGQFIDLNGSKESVKCMICSYSYFKDGFKYQSYACNGFHDISMIVMNLSDFFISNIKGVDYRVCFSDVDKKEVVNILNNSKLGNKGVL